MTTRNGFTLIEMLVSLVILTSIMLLSSEAYRYFVVQLNQRQDSFNTVSEHFKRLKWLQHQIASTSMYYVTTVEGKKQLLFSGSKNALLWVSTTSVTKPGTGSVSAMAIEDGHLRYCEKVLDETFLTKANISQQDVCSEFSLNIVPATALTLEYYGWLDLTAQLSQNPINPVMNAASTATWQDKYFSSETGTLPGLIKMTVKNDTSSQEYWVQLHGLDPAKAGYFNNASSG